MRTLLLALFFAALLPCVSCTEYTIRVRIFDVKGKPVMDGTVGVRGVIVKSFTTDAQGKKMPVLRRFEHVEEWGTGEVEFKVRGEPTIIDIAADPPGYEKLVAQIKREGEPPEYGDFVVKDAGYPYSTMHIKIYEEPRRVTLDAFVIAKEKPRPIWER